jgi:ribosomal-protein-alanine N-acetyltransferase
LVKLSPRQEVVMVKSKLAGMPAMPYVVRRMTLEDISQVSEIDREAFPTEWPPPSFRRELQSHMVRYLVAVEDNEQIRQVRSVRNTSGGRFGTWFSRVGELITRRQLSSLTQDRIVGYVAIWMMVDESHLTSIAVRKDFRRHGIGELLLLSVTRLSIEMKADVVTLETRVSNTAAQALYEKYGFKKVGLRRRYYSDNHEDALIMTTDKLASASYQSRLHDLEQRYSERYGPPKLRLQLADSPAG